MQPKWTRRVGLAAIVGAAASASIGCAEERDAISRVQPNVLDKSFFVGADLKSTNDDPEFYMRNTVVDVPYGASQDGLFTATYAQPVNRIKWEIQETSLIARLTYEKVANSDMKGSKRTNDGQVVAMFAITSHFDVRRAYNGTTGEESNVVEENSTDRPWDQRRSFRVDWSKNLVTDGYQVDTLSAMGLFGGPKFQPIAYYVQDPKDPNAPHFVEKEGYFDVTQKVFATPELVDFSEYGYGMIPACYLTSNYPVGNCNSTEVTLRLAFRKIVDTDFEPTEWNGQMMQAFGVFTEDRYGYDRNYQITDDRWHRFQAKHNVWNKSHIEGSQCAVDYWRDENGAIQNYKVEGAKFATDPKTGLPIPDKAGKPFPGTPTGAKAHRNDNGNANEDDCEFEDASSNLLHKGSRCDEFAKKCTLPAYERETKTIPWYYGPDSPADLFSSTAEALNSWNDATRHALQVRMKLEADRAGVTPPKAYVTDEEAIKADTKGATVPHVFVLCHNPVVEGDDKGCGAPGLQVRVGDLRYYMVNLIDTPQTPSPWGIMVDAVDPLTGEVIAASANEWMHVLDTAAQGTQDLLKWFNGEISDRDVSSGEYLKDWIAASKMGTAQYQPRTLSAEESNKAVKAIDLGLITKTGPAFTGKIPHDAKTLRSAAESLTRRTGPSLDTQFDAVRTSLLNSPLETMLVTPSQLEKAGLDPREPMTKLRMEQASPLRGQNRQLRQFIEKMKMATQARNGACTIEQPEPNGLAGLARLANRLYPPPAKKLEDGTENPEYSAQIHVRDTKVHQWVRAQMHLGVISHELGHSMGLRHNFNGTWDALNYHKEYWQLRTRNNAEKSCRAIDDTAACNRFGGGLGSRGCNFGVTRHTDGNECVGPRWVDPVTEAETDGLIWMYGTTTVMDYPGDVSQDMIGLGAYDRAAVRYFYGETMDVEAEPMSAQLKEDYEGMLDRDSPSYFGFHYSEMNDKFKLLGKCELRDGADANNALSYKCQGPRVEQVLRSEMVDKGDSYAVEDRAGRVRHPYMFNSDEYATPSNIANNRFDSGADAYEKAMYLKTAYENRYIFDNFRRGRVQFSSMGVASRIQSRYFEMLTGMTKTLGLYAQIYGEIFNKPTVDFLLDDVGYFRSLALASSEGFNLLAQVLTRPEPGDYGVFTQADGSKYARVRKDLELTEGQPGFTPKAFDIAAGSGEGRYISNDYDFRRGAYFWSDYQTRVGTVYEKIMAIEMMTEAYNRFVQVDSRDFIDGRWKNINYATLYPEQMRRLFAALMQGDPLTLGPYVAPAAGGATINPVPRVQYVDWTDTKETVIPANAVTLDPLYGWEQQYPALIYGFFYSPTTMTMDWYDQARVWVKGGDEEVDVRGAVVSFEDPESRIVYNARAYGTESVRGRTVLRNSGGRMIEFANKLRLEAYATAAGEVQYGADGKPVVKDEAAALQLRKYVSNLAVVRQVSEWFGAGPLGRGQ